MEDHIEKSGEVRLRRIDIGTWKSDVAKQHGINRLPTLWVYDGTRRVTTDTRQALDLLQQR